MCKRPSLEFSLTLNQFQTVCPKFETKCLGKIGNSKVFSAQNQVISKKKKKGLRQNSGRFFSQFRKFKRLRGGLFSYGGGYFPFFTENRPQKHKNRAILQTSQANGGCSSPPPLATLLLSSAVEQFWLLGFKICSTGRHLHSYVRLMITNKTEICIKCRVINGPTTSGPNINLKPKSCPKN